MNIKIRTSFDAVHSGFAAGCEARLCLAVRTLIVLWLCPRFGLCPNVQAKGRTRGLAQSLENLDGEAEPRLTSGGKAGVDEVKFQDRLDLQDRVMLPEIRKLLKMNKSGSGACPRCSECGGKPLFLTCSFSTT